METPARNDAVVAGGVPDPPKLPPKSPLRGLRPAASLNALALSAATAAAHDSFVPSSSSVLVPTTAPHRPPPIIVPPLPPLPVKDSNGVQLQPPGVSRSTSTRSLKNRPQSLQTSRRPSTASSILSTDNDSSAALGTPTSLDSISRIALAPTSDSNNLGGIEQTDATDTMVVASLTIPPSTGLDRLLPPTPVSAVPSASSSTLTSTSALPPQTSKRTHALLELLTSERVYASDLAVMRYVHIPLALGQRPRIQLPPQSATDGPSSSSAPMTLDELTEPPMGAEDVRVIFSNTEELAVFADAFAERIESSIGDAILSTPEGASLASSSTPQPSKDSIGALLLEVVSLAAHSISLSLVHRNHADTR